MIARLSAFVRSLFPRVDAVHVAVVPEDVAARLRETPGARLRAVFSVIEPVETERVTYVVETEETEV